MGAFSLFLEDQLSKDSLKNLITYLKKPIVYHTLFWVGYFLFNTLRWGNYFNDYAYSLKSNLVEFPIHLVLVYFNLYYLLPKFIPNKLGRYLTFLGLALIIMSLIRIVLTYYLVTTEIWRESVVKDQSMFGLNYILAVAIGELYVIGLTTAIKLTIDWVGSQRRARELERRNHETELSFLRSQVQPHFFFNTLNNLYSLTLDKSEKAPETVLKLSELMSHVIYKGKNKKVSLTEEIDHINTYIDLETIRYGNPQIAMLEITGNISNKQIPPLILMPFIENAFKHGTGYISGEKPIRIQLKVEGNTLYFSVINSKSTAKKSLLRHQKGSSGIGIQNTLRRLELLYDKDFSLEIVDTSTRYMISLKILLNEA